MTKAELLARCIATPLTHSPGERWAYSNLGFSVLAALVEEVSGEKIDHYLKSRFFLRLGLDGKHWQVAGNGGMQPSAVDMYHWYLAMDGRLPFDRELTEMMFAPRERRTERHSATYGWLRIPVEGGDAAYIGHEGSEGSFYSAFIWRPKDRISSTSPAITGKTRCFRYSAVSARWPLGAHRNRSSASRRTLCVPQHRERTTRCGREGRR